MQETSEELTMQWKVGSNLMKQVERLQGTIFTSSSYCDIALPKNSIIYCDPPYEGCCRI